MDLGTYERHVDDHKDRVFALALTLLGQRQDAEDVTQETLIKLWDQGRALAPAHVGPWLLRVARNASYDLLRRRQVRQRVHGDEDGDPIADRTVDDRAGDPHDDAERACFRRRLQQAIAHLPASIRTVVVLREIQGMAYDDIAQAVDRPLNTVKVYLHRGRKLLRTALDEEPRHAQAS
ncbi:MAG: RNA polymerase sigma factor [Acidobacteriota bacterium]